MSSAAAPKRKRVDNKVYAVRVGNKPGLYHSWSDCQEQVKGFKGAVCKFVIYGKQNNKFEPRVAQCV
jgi:viroplasmin and RNaseH domain-containing protein